MSEPSLAANSQLWNQPVETRGDEGRGAERVDYCQVEQYRRRSCSTPGSASRSAPDPRGSPPLFDWWTGNLQLARTYGDCSRHDDNERARSRPLAATQQAQCPDQIQFAAELHQSWAAQCVAVWGTSEGGWHHVNCSPARRAQHMQRPRGQPRLRPGACWTSGRAGHL